MCMVRVSVSGFEFEGNDEVFVSLPVIASDLHCGIDISFQSIHRGGDMLFDLKKLVDAQLHLRTVSVFDHRLFLLFLISRDLGGRK